MSGYEKPRNQSEIEVILGGGIIDEKTIDEKTAELVRIINRLNTTFLYADVKLALFRKS